jgi:hypothetical protein
MPFFQNFINTVIYTVNYQIPILFEPETGSIPIWNYYDFFPKIFTRNDPILVAKKKQVRFFRRLLTFGEISNGTYDLFEILGQFSIFFLEKTIIFGKCPEIEKEDSAAQ